MSSSTSGNNEFRCNECGITFTTVQDKEEHMKLEHRESKGPAGVKWAYNAQSIQGYEPAHTSSSFPDGKNCLTATRVQASCLLFLAPSNSSCFVISREWECYSRSEMDAHNLCRRWLTRLIRSLPVDEIFHCSYQDPTFCRRRSSLHTAAAPSPRYPIISAVRLLFLNK
jgi:hypothetical protein